MFNYVYEFIYINESYLWIIYAYTYVYVKVEFEMDNTHDLMVNGLRSRESLFREESDLNMVNSLGSRKLL